MTRFLLRGAHRRAVTAAVLLTTLGACASLPHDASEGSPASGPAQAAPPGRAANGATTAGPPAASAQAQAPGAGAPRPGESSSLRPFIDVTKDAKELKGYFSFWQKDDRVWLEIKPEQLEKPFFFGNSLASGLGEGFFYPGLMGTEQVVYLRRIGNAVQLVAKNLQVRAPVGSPLERAVKESYSDSLLGATPVVSALHPERKSFLIDAAALFGTDLMGAQTQLESVFRLPYGFDRANSSIERVSADGNGSYLTYRAHFVLPKLPAPPVMSNGPQPAPPRLLPDGRSLFLSFAYTLAPLPEQPMRARMADQRVGHFTSAFHDLADVDSGDYRKHLVERWRLEKKDPNALLSEPKEPIRVVMDRNIPEQYRAAIKSGILEWNKAFERLGFKNALVVEQQAADADWTTFEGVRHLAVRWFVMQGPGAVAVGPSQADPRTGEILRAAVIIPENWARLERTRVREALPTLPSAAANNLVDAANLAAYARTCSYASEALEHTAFGFELLAARGDLTPTSEDGQRFIADSLKDVTMHEMGHALGLRHNFKASSGIKLEKLRDAQFVQTHGISNSVMDYNALNLPLANEKPVQFNNPTIGAYDYWAIEYAYRELPSQIETAELQKIAARAAIDPALRYAPDEDILPQLGGGFDPLASQFDLGDDPLRYSQRSMLLARELWSRTAQRQLAASDNLAVLRRNVQRGLGAFQSVVPIISRFVGGMNTSRDTAGDGKVALLTPVPSVRQREALNVLAKEVFSIDSFRFDPALMRRLGTEQLERFPSVGAPPPQSLDFSLPSAVLNIQRTALDQLMSDAVAARLADAESKVSDRQQLVTLSEVHLQLNRAIWSELAHGGDRGVDKGVEKRSEKGREIDSLRRNLQREHARRVAAGLLRPVAAVAADVRPVHRQVALKLQADLKRALTRTNWNANTRAHLAESLEVISDALKAPLIRQGV